MRVNTAKRRSTAILPSGPQHGPDVHLSCAGRYAVGGKRWTHAGQGEGKYGAILRTRAVHLEVLGGTGFDARVVIRGLLRRPVRGWAGFRTGVWCSPAEESGPGFLA